MHVLAEPEPLTVTSSLQVRLWVVAVTLSAFGPYILGGMRTEQLSVYLSTLLVVVIGWPILKSNYRSVAPFIFLWGAYFLVALVGGFLSGENRTPYDRGSLVAGLDNAALPLAVLVVTCFWTSVAPGLDLVRIAATTLVSAMTVNGLLAVGEMIRGGVASFGWLRIFWSSNGGTSDEGGGVSVAVLAAGNGRYSGVFNQPAEAGIAYSLALFSLAYLLQLNTRHRTTVFALIGVVLTVGGVLTASKIFLLGGLPIMVFLVLRDRNRRTRLRLAAAVSAVGVVSYLLNFYGLLPRWPGAAMIDRLVNRGNRSILQTITAGRFGEGSTLAGPSGEILDHHRWFGLGAGGLAVPYDSTWLEALVVAGVVGVLLVALTFLLLSATWYGLRDVLPRREWLFAGSVVFLAAGASLGMPSLTGNRVATLVWVLLGLLITNRRAKAVADGSAPFRVAWLDRFLAERRGDAGVTREPTVTVRGGCREENGP